MRALDGIATHIARDDPSAARRIVARVEEAATELARHPALGRSGRVAGTRELVVPGTPFILPYRVREDAVEMLTVLHTARRWPDEF